MNMNDIIESSLPRTAQSFKRNPGNINGTDGDVRIHPKVVGKDAAKPCLGLAIEMPVYVRTGWAISPLHEYETTVLVWPCRSSISGTECYFSVGMVSHWLRAGTIESLLMSGCG